MGEETIRVVRDLVGRYRFGDINWVHLDNIDVTVSMTRWDEPIRDNNGSRLSRGFREDAFGNNHDVVGPLEGWCINFDWTETLGVIVNNCLG